MCSIWVKAELVVRNCLFEPEVHDYSEVIWIWTGSCDDEFLVFVGICIATVWCALATPDYVSTVLRIDVVTAGSTEDGVPSCASPDYVIALLAKNGVLIFVSVKFVGIVSTVNVIISGSTVDGIASFTSVQGIISELISETIAVEVRVSGVVGDGRGISREVIAPDIVVSITSPDLVVTGFSVQYVIT